MPFNSNSILDYDDYRKFLSDFYENKRKKVSGYSFRSFSKKAGLSTPNYLQKVIQGQRNLGPKLLLKFVNALDLTGPFADYFCVLVQLNQSGSTPKSKEYKRKLEEIRTSILSQKSFELNSEKYLSHWIFPTVRELLSIGIPKGDIYRIHAILNDSVDLQFLQSAFNLLMECGVLESDGDNGYKTRPGIITTNEISKSTLRSYHKSILEQAIRVLTTLSSKDRSYRALTFKINAEFKPEIEKEIFEFRKRIFNLIKNKNNEKKPDTVMQLNIQLYPITKKINQLKDKE